MGTRHITFTAIFDDPWLIYKSLLYSTDPTYFNDSHLCHLGINIIYKIVTLYHVITTFYLLVMTKISYSAIVLSALRLIGIPVRYFISIFYLLSPISLKVPSKLRTVRHIWHPSKMSHNWLFVFRKTEYKSCICLLNPFITDFYLGANSVYKRDHFFRTKNFYYVEQ